MNNLKQQILYSVFENLLLVGLMIATPAIVMLDVVIIGHGIPESSFTEIAQEALILMSSLIFAYDAWKSTQARGFLVLVAGFFGCMFIRECDALFDNITKGFWLYPALMLAFGSIYYAANHPNTVIVPMVDHITSKQFSYLFIGLIFILIFSRLFGTGYLWRDIMGDDYNSLYKNIIQEGLELSGYILVWFGSLSHLLSRLPVNNKKKITTKIIQSPSKAAYSFRTFL